jgi:hypothetical protein
VVVTEELPVEAAVVEDPVEEDPELVVTEYQPVVTSEQTNGVKEGGASFTFFPKPMPQLFLNACPPAVSFGFCFSFQRNSLTGQPLLFSHDIWLT